MNRWLGVGVLASAALASASAVLQPLPTLAAIGASVGFFLFLLIPKEKISFFAGISTILLLILVPVQNVAIYGNLKFVVLGATVALTVGTLLRRYDSMRSGVRGLWLFIAYFLVIALATPRSNEPASWNLFLGILIAGLGPALIFAMMSGSERRSALNWIVGLAGVEALYAVYEMIARPRPLWGYASTSASGDPHLMYNQVITSLVRAQGTLGHPLPLALFLLVGLALAIRGIGPANRLHRAWLVALLFAGCFAAGSRSAMAVAVLLLFLGIGSKRWKALVVGGYLLVLGGLASVAAGALESEVVKRFLGSSSLTHRAGALEAVPRLLEEQSMSANLFGNGYFSAYQLFRAGLLQSGRFFAVDNQFVMTLVEGGLLTVVLVLALVVVALKSIEASLRLGLLSIVVFFFSFDVLSWPSGMAIFAMFVGLACSSPKRAEILSNSDKMMLSARVLASARS